MTVRAIRLGGPMSNLCGAIGLLQAHILASETNLDAQGLFKHHHMPEMSVELALALLLPVLSEVGGEWNYPAKEVEA
jgi:hypothetical protein